MFSNSCSFKKDLLIPVGTLQRNGSIGCSSFGWIIAGYWVILRPCSCMKRGRFLRLAWRPGSPRLAWSPDSPRLVWSPDSSPFIISSFISSSCWILWVLMCCFMLYRWMNLLGQWGHLCGLSPLWIFLCLYKLLGSASFFPQTSQATAGLPLAPISPVLIPPTGCFSILSASLLESRSLPLDKGDAGSVGSPELPLPPNPCIPFSQA